MPAKKRALGRGLDALFSTAAPVATAPPDTDDSPLRSVSVDDIRPNPHQPRSRFDPEKLEELAASIRSKGVLQPIVLRRGEEGFEIVAGERRWRAAQRAGLHQIPALIGDYDDRAMLEAALVENVQREDLNPLEEAVAYQQLIKEFGVTQEALAESLGKSRAAIANAMRLLRLPREVQSLIEQGELSAGHARALVSVSPAARQTALARMIVKRGLNVREAERLAKPQEDARTARRSGRAANGSRRDDVNEIQEKLAWKLGLKVRVHTKSNSSGRVEVFYSSLDEFQKLCEQLGLVLD